jgi:hypothetical protein
LDPPPERNEEELGNCSQTQRDQIIAPIPVAAVAPLAPPAAVGQVNQEEALANSGILTDLEIKNLNFRCLIWEQDSINLLSNPFQQFAKRDSQLS